MSGCLSSQIQAVGCLHTTAWKNKFIIQTESRKLEFTVKIGKKRTTEAAVTLQQQSQTRPKQVCSNTTCRLEAVLKRFQSLLYMHELDGILCHLVYRGQTYTHCFTLHSELLYNFPMFFFQDSQVLTVKKAVMPGRLKKKSKPDL